MRVLYLVRWIDVPTRLLIERTAKRQGVSVAVYTESAESRSELSPSIDCRPFRSYGKVDPLAIGVIRRRLKQDRFDVVHAMSSRYLANALLATRGLEHQPAICGFVGHINRGYSRRNPLHRLTYHHPRLAATWCNCQAAAEPLARSGVPREKLFAIYAGMPCGAPPATTDGGVRRELGLPDDALVVGFAGNMRPVKGVDVLLNAALQLKHCPSIHWLLLGRVEDRQVAQLAQHPDIRDRVHCLGWRDDAERLMPAMDVFAMPSRSEGFSRAIMEAMERGLCPVATRVGGTPELIRDGVDGLLVPPEDATALAAAIRRLAHDSSLRTTLALNARQRIKTDFTIESMVKQMLAMYRTTLQGHGGRGDRRRVADPIILRFPKRSPGAINRSAGEPKSLPHNRRAA